MKSVTEHITILWIITTVQVHMLTLIVIIEYIVVLNKPVLDYKT